MKTKAIIVASLLSALTLPVFAQTGAPTAAPGSPAPASAQGTNPGPGPATKAETATKAEAHKVKKATKKTAKKAKAKIDHATGADKPAADSTTK
ncbi:hypothetical protein J8I26_01635 [Herbaspirillum sp. LeCh32-8]|uniref:hypothetical protein n=1 Tax=Herbaspirillum sp. LeCh32-8 TaxID=2821356 RepID=UPI001AE6D806|nr:hypothetical protein [Herbaspirillum sp. LeCh32-8]MBP0596791.1 hypothetical protein [Herbaspirillum sp. LeCh32-8]